MEGTRLILNDGAVIEGGQAGLSEGFLWLYLPGMTMQEAAAIAFDTNKTKRIWFQFGEEEAEYAGYTNCTRIMENGAEVSVCLTRG